MLPPAPRPASATSILPRGSLRRSLGRCAAVAASITVVAVACTRERNDAPRTEFIVAAGDSSYWIRSDASGITLRGSPLVLARLDGRFMELYVEDDDHSFENAVFVGQRLYERDIATGDSMEIFHDTVVPTLADRYQRAHPDLEPLGPDEDPNEDAATSATADVTVLGVHGPYLSLEYQVDTTGSGDDVWRTTRHGVIDMRTGTPATLSDIIGPEQARTITGRARSLYAETIDSIRANHTPEGRRAARAIGHFRFDPTSFSLAAPNGTLMIAFSAPGQGTGGEGFVLPLRPIPVVEPTWWRDARAALPTESREREERWTRGSYTVRAAYDSGSLSARLTLVDSAQRAFTIGGVSAPVHRIYWLDQPRLDTSMRNALSRAFDEAAAYDEDTRAAQAPSSRTPGGPRLASLP
jgi:hypothetical protein